MNFQAHDEDDIRHLQIQNLAEDWLNEGDLTPPQYEAVKEAFPTDIKPYNIFIKLGLFIFTLLCIFFIGLVWGLITMPSYKDFEMIGIWLLGYGVVLIAATEYYIREKHWYQQGGDNALYYASIFCCVVGTSIMTRLESPLAYSIISLIFLVLGAWRYGDTLLAISAFYCLIYSFIMGYDEAGISPFTLPFVSATLSLVVYFLSKKAAQNEGLFYWENMWQGLEIVGLTTFYISCNYYVVESFLEDSSEITGLPSPYNYIFIFLTTFIPLFYLIIGIQTKNRLLWNMGALGIVASGLTYRQYHSVLPIEWALTLIGIAVLVLAFLLLKYLKTAQKGFTYQPNNKKTHLLETLIISQVLQQTSSAVPEDSVKLGGGDFGGGGASDSF